MRFHLTHKGESNKKSLTIQALNPLINFKKRGSFFETGRCGWLKNRQKNITDRLTMQTSG
jgi:hypothetical protein